MYIKYTYYNIIITLSGADEARAAKRPRLDTEGMINTRLVVLYKYQINKKMKRGQESLKKLTKQGVIAGVVM